MLQRGLDVLVKVRAARELGGLVAVAGAQQEVPLLLLPLGVGFGVEVEASWNKRAFSQSSTWIAPLRTSIATVAVPSSMAISASRSAVMTRKAASLSFGFR